MNSETILIFCLLEQLTFFSIKGRSMVQCPGNKQRRIQAKEHSQHTPDDTNVDLLAGIHHTVVALGEKKNSRCIDGKINEPLVLNEEPQNCGEAEYTVLQ